MAYYGYPYQYQNAFLPGALQQPMQQPIQQQPVQSGFISVRSVEEAYNWPVAPGNSLMFKDENSPYVYTKTRSFSQLDQPVFERYRLVKEGDNGPSEAQTAPSRSKDDITALWEEVRLLQAQIDELKPKPRRRKDEPTELTKPVQPVHAEPGSDAE
jgi:hypothetical protein